MGAISRVTPTLTVCSGLSFLDSYQFPTSVEPFTPVLRDTPLPRPPAYATTMLAPTVMQESTLSHNEFALCLRWLLRPSSACLHVNLPHVSKHLFPPLFPRAYLRFRDPPWPCLEVNSNHYTCERLLPPMFLQDLDSLAPGLDNQPGP